MVRSGLISALGRKTGIRKGDLADVLDALAEVVREELMAIPENGKVAIPGVVILRKRLAQPRKAQLWRSPITGETTEIPPKPARLVVKAFIDRTLKQAVEQR